LKSWIWMDDALTKYWLRAANSNRKMTKADA
jgi:hypothetical protein